VSFGIHLLGYNAVQLGKHWCFRGTRYL